VVSGRIVLGGRRRQRSGDPRRAALDRGGEDLQHDLADDDGEVVAVTLYSSKAEISMLRSFASKVLAEWWTTKWQTI